MPTIDVDRETAHDAAVRELARPIYPKASLGDRISAWLSDLLHRFLDSGAGLPGGWLTIVVLGLLVAAALAVAVRIARNTLGGRRSGGLHAGRILSAADHRGRAEDFAAQGDWVNAIRQRVQAIGRELEENGVLNPVAGRTAAEMARDAGAAIPHCGAELSAAATVFNDVTYGEREGTEQEYRSISALDDRVRHEVTGRDRVAQ